jgi:FkbM family methyltransferase
MQSMKHLAITHGRHGQFLYNRHDRFVGRSLAFYGEWSESEVGLFRQIVRPGDVVVEAGSNIGSHTIFLSQAVGDTGQVYAFEAGRHTHQLLCANLALNECFNVVALHKAVGRMAGRVEFPVLEPREEANFGEASIRHAQTSPKKEWVDLLSIDALELGRLDFVKSDIEGYEGELLHGAQSTIRRCRPVVYLEIDCANGQPAGNRDELVSFLDAENYACYYYVSPMFNPENFRKEAENIMNAVSVDMVCVPIERARVTGLTQARIDDGAITIEPGLLTSTVLPWHQAQFTYL